MGLHRWRLTVAKAVRKREKQHWWRAFKSGPHSAYLLAAQAQCSWTRAGGLSECPAWWLERPRPVGRKALTRIRCGHHELRICTGAWDGLDEEDRWCPLCAQAVETEQHFLIDCTVCEDERRALYGAIDAMVTQANADGDEPSAFSVQQLSRDEQWRLLTGGSHGSISGDRLKQRVHALILVAIAQWTLERKELLAKLEESRRA